MKPTRRNFIQSLGVGVAGLGISQQAVANTANVPKSVKPVADEQILFVATTSLLLILSMEKYEVSFFVAFISF